MCLLIVAGLTAGSGSRVPPSPQCVQCVAVPRLCRAGCTFDHQDLRTIEAAATAGASGGGGLGWGLRGGLGGGAPPPFNPGRCIACEYGPAADADVNYVGVTLPPAHRSARPMPGDSGGRGGRGGRRGAVTIDQPRPFTLGINSNGGVWCPCMAPGERQPDGTPGPPVPCAAGPFNATADILLLRPAMVTATSTFLFWTISRVFPPAVHPSSSVMRRAPCCTWQPCLFGC